ncbi:MAG: NAD(P)-dependent glycerol-3-phosphate dehydrogenase, partial [Deltaproteobacteria bacterium]
MTKEKNIAVIGAGSWGTALALLLCQKGKPVTLWGHRAEHVNQLATEGQNRRYLPGYPFPYNLSMTADLGAAVQDSSFVVMVVPSHGFRAVFRQLKNRLTDGAIVVSATKGIENSSLMTMLQVVAEELGDNAQNIQLAVLSGPSFAKEVAARKPTAVTVASQELNVAQQVQQVFFTERFRVYAGTDVVGVELGGPLKNVVAIAAGISDGLGFGTNARAALITRGLAEITRLAVKMGANPLTMSGLAGLGDLVLTCTGDLSRNRTVGLQLGQGKSLKAILADMDMVAEGVKT